MDLKELSKLAVKFRDERDWKQFHTPKDLAVSISIEAAELLELFQWKSNGDSDSFLSDPKNKEKLEHELADVLLYCLSLADVADVDLEKAVVEKLKVNGGRYPVEKCKGKAWKYCDLG